MLRKEKENQFSSSCSSQGCKQAGTTSTMYQNTPSKQNPLFNSGAKQRVIHVVEVQEDPMEPPKFKITSKIPHGPPSPPTPVLHSPPRKVTIREQQEWKIPLCISNWKNNCGYAIPLDMRLAADERGLQDHTINNNIMKLGQY